MRDLDRFWSNVQEAAWDECWLWLGTRAGKYGSIYVSERQRSVGAHRFAYEVLVASIPEGLWIDHLCRVTLCVNPWHMEPVTPQVNLLRSDGPSAQHAKQTHCLRNHPFDEANTYRPKRGGRVCRRCRADAEAARRLQAA